METMFAIPYAHPKRWLRVSTPFGEVPMFAQGIDSLKHIWTIADEQREYTVGMPWRTRVQMAAESYSKALVASCLHLLKVKKPMIISYRSWSHRRLAVRIRGLYEKFGDANYKVYHNLWYDHEIKAMSRELGYEPRVFTWREDDVYTDSPPLLWLDDPELNENGTAVISNELYKKGFI